MPYEMPNRFVGKDDFDSVYGDLKVFLSIEPIATGKKTWDRVGEIKY